MRRTLLTLLLCTSCTRETADDAGRLPLVSGLAISKVSLNQAVEVPLTSGERSPIVAGRGGLLRVSLTPDPGFEPRDVVAVLELSDGEQPLPPRVQRRAVSSESDDADLTTTFNFELAADTVTEALALSLSLREASGLVEGRPESAASFPVRGKLAVGAKPSGALRLVLVPLGYQADGSSRMPDLSEQQVALHREALRSRYPAREIEVRVRDPIPLAFALAANGEGWGEALQLLLSRRAQDRGDGTADANEYFYGVVAPAGSFAQYCGQSPSCLLGLSTPDVSPDSEFGRGSVGLGFAGAEFAETLAHELGHAHGRLHAPCAPYGFIQNVDPDYPYPSGETGGWGYDLPSGRLLSPSSSFDLMSYCQPAWVSDYTWRGLFQRIVHVNGVTSGESGGGAMRIVTVSGQGELRLGSRLWLDAAPLGQPRQVEVTGSGAPERRRERAAFFAYSHLPGGFLLVPAPRPGDRTLRVGAAEIRWEVGENPLPSR